MSIKEFTEIVRKEMETRTGKEVRVEEVTKNNGIKKTGLLVLDKEINITPTIYLEPFWDFYQIHKDIKKVIDEIWNTYNRDKLSSYFDMSWFRDFEKVKDKVAYKLVNFAANKELLKDIPHKRVLDLVKVYYVTVKDGLIGSGSILIHNSHLELWGITPEQVEEIAVENTPKLFPVEISSMEDVLREVYRNSKMEDELEEMIEACPMYVVSNTVRVFGAASMCYADFFGGIAEQLGNDLFIVPCSVHELIIIPAIKGSDVYRLKSMVCEVNRTQVEMDEVLSDSVYVYNRKKDSIAIV